jgi:hypothetical protein
MCGCGVRVAVVTEHRNHALEERRRLGENPDLRIIGVFEGTVGQPYTYILMDVPRILFGLKKYRDWFQTSILTRLRTEGRVFWRDQL